MTNAEFRFEVEVASVGEFLRLLLEREEVFPDRQGDEASGKAIFVARMLDRRPSNYGFPLIRRYVVAAFAYGRDRVSYTTTTSNAVEMPETMVKIEDRQREAYEEVGTEIKRGLRELGLGIPVVQGSLRLAAGYRR